MSNFLDAFFGKFKTSKGHSEINGPLVIGNTSISEWNSEFWFTVPESDRLFPNQLPLWLRQESGLWFYAKGL